MAGGSELGTCRDSFVVCPYLCVHMCMCVIIYVM